MVLNKRGAIILKIKKRAFLVTRTKIPKEGGINIFKHKKFDILMLVL